MRKQSIFIIAFSLLALSLYAGGAKLHNKMGIGYEASVTTTPTEFVFEQSPSAEIVDNGTFATTNSWTLGAGWAIGSGDATYTNGIAGTNSMTQAGLSLTTNEKYRLTYTVSEISGSNATFTPSLGNAFYAAKTANGTYTEDVSFFGTATLAFSFSSTDGATGTVDNVTLLEAPDSAYVQRIDLTSTSLASTVYFNFNCTAEQFTNLYSAGRCMRLEGKTLELESDQPLFNMWYRTATGTESFTLNGL